MQSKSSFALACIPHLVLVLCTSESAQHVQEALAAAQRACRHADRPLAAARRLPPLAALFAAPSQRCPAAFTAASAAVAETWYAVWRPGGVHADDVRAHSPGRAPYQWTQQLAAHHADLSVPVVTRAQIAQESARQRLQGHLADSDAESDSAQSGSQSGDAAQPHASQRGWAVRAPRSRRPRQPREDFAAFVSLLKHGAGPAEAALAAVNAAREKAAQVRRRLQSCISLNSLAALESASTTQQNFTNVQYGEAHRLQRDRVSAAHSRAVRRL